MAFFDELKDRAIDLGRAGVAKSKQMAEITKLSLNNAAEEDAIRKAYQEIGKLYYAERGMAAEPAYVALCQRITDAKAKIEENKAKIARLKEEGGAAPQGTSDSQSAGEQAEPPVEDAPAESAAAEAQQDPAGQIPQQVPPQAPPAQDPPAP